MKKAIYRVLSLCLALSVVLSVAFAGDLSGDAVETYSVDYGAEAMSQDADESSLGIESPDESSSASSGDSSQDKNSSDTDSGDVEPEPEPSHSDSNDNNDDTGDNDGNGGSGAENHHSTKVVDIDIEYQSTMTVGTTQVLSPTAIYDDFSTSVDSKYTYSSSKKSVATVNALGRVTALKQGTVKISIKCNGYTKKVAIEIKEEEAVEEAATVAVKDLDFGDYESKLEVGKTMALSVSVIPSTATDQTITYSSSNTKVATVNALGRVTGVSSGTVKITAKSGKVSKSITLTVEVKTEGIIVDESYVVIKPDESYQISATVKPANAPQGLTYTSSDKSVATVSSSGVITAVKSGDCSITVSNSSSKAVISVIVNQNTDETMTADESSVDMQELEVSSPTLLEIQNGEDGKEFFVYQKDMEVITSDILSALYGTKKKLTVVCDGYHISVNGSDIKNINNPVQTDIHLSVEDKEATFLMNHEGSNLCGSVTITFVDTCEGFCWLYLYNDALTKWQPLNSYSNNAVKVDTRGQYMLRKKKLSFTVVQWWAIAVGVCIILAASVAYIVTKKQYWFWR